MATDTFSIAIHGGAGTILRTSLTSQKEKEYRNALEDALRAGTFVLGKGGSALEAVQAAVMSLEDCPLFNAGRGSVFTSVGTHEMDASIMNGATRMAGAVAGVSGIKNPVQLARLVMEKSEHVLLCGKGAEEFGRFMGVPFEEESYFHTDFRHEQWKQAQQEGRIQLDHTPDEKKFGTVGAVAMDIQGNLAAATSTGGMTNKKYGRVGDSPLIGSGTFADNSTCAISCTGHGEFFIRSVVAYDVSCLMEYKGFSLRQACEEVVLKKLVNSGGEGGLIAIDRSGIPVLCFNSEGMYRGYQVGGDNPVTAIYGD